MLRDSEARSFYYPILALRYSFCFVHAHTHTRMYARPCLPSRLCPLHLTAYDSLSLFRILYGIFRICPPRFPTRGFFVALSSLPVRAYPSFLLSCLSFSVCSVFFFFLLRVNLMEPRIIRRVHFCGSFDAEYLFRVLISRGYKTERASRQVKRPFRRFRLIFACRAEIMIYEKRSPGWSRIRLVPRRFRALSRGIRRILLAADKSATFRTRFRLRPRKSASRPHKREPLPSSLAQTVYFHRGCVPRHRLRARYRPDYARARLNRARN